MLLSKQSPDSPILSRTGVLGGGVYNSGRVLSGIARRVKNATFFTAPEIILCKQPLSLATGASRGGEKIMEEIPLH